MSSRDKKPAITPADNGPYLVSGLETLYNSKGEKLDTKPQIALCRCGGSKNKPFCDGTHNTIGFSGKKLKDGSKDERDNYAGKEITIHDNRGICAHAGRCSDGLPAVFRLKEEPWIHADAATRDEVINTIKQCPSGALSYTTGGTEHRDQKRDPAILVSRNGPYVITGSPELVGVERDEGASTEHFTLCRCGGSKNKPFCDGTHWYIKFQDDDN